MTGGFGAKSLWTSARFTCRPRDFKDNHLCKCIDLGVEGRFDGTHIPLKGPRPSETFGFRAEVLILPGQRIWMVRFGEPQKGRKWLSGRTLHVHLDSYACMANRYGRLGFATAGLMKCGSDPHFLVRFAQSKPLMFILAPLSAATELTCTFGCPTCSRLSEAASTKQNISKQYQYKVH